MNLTNHTIRLVQSYQTRNFQKRFITSSFLLQERQTDSKTPSSPPANVVGRSPLPLRFEADVLNGVPPSVTQRSVRIYRPAKTAMQSGKANSASWKLDFDVQQKWENPLMGWASSADTVQALRVTFNSKEDAILFAERQGYDFWVDEPKEPVFQVKSYAENFKYVPGKLRHMRTK